MAWLSYTPGLNGSFLFDDFANLPALGATGPIDDWPAFWRYITSGTADPTGRPLTLLTFLLDAQNWPASPLPFKRTSLVLHLVNGALLFLLLSRLGRLLGTEPARCTRAALAGTALWLLHPLFVSTTLYIVQREAMLPATCVLSGLLIWLHGREKLAHGHWNTGITSSVLGLGGFTLLGTLAKANGALLPLLALLIEWVIFIPRHPMPTPSTRYWHRVTLLTFAILPATALLAYIAWQGINGITTGGPVGTRPWSTLQRLLTEPRVLVDYLSLLWFPRPFSSGLFNDGYVFSTSLWHPTTTLPSLLLISGLVVLAVHLRHRHPSLTLAILFYFTGHLLESTTLPLELYFEHRNYLPALLMFWPLSLWLADWRKLRAIKIPLLAILPLSLASMTHARAELWGNETQQVMLWARINPDSARAQANAAATDLEAGHPQAAIDRITPLLAQHPEEIQLALNLLTAHCQAGSLHLSDINTAKRAMKITANPGSLLISWFDRTLPVVATGGCKGLTLRDLANLAETALENPRLAGEGRQQDLLFIRGRIELNQNQPDAALTSFMEALTQNMRPAFALEAAATLGRSGHPELGLNLLDYYASMNHQTESPAFGMPMIHAWILEKQNWWPNELAHLRRQLMDDARHAQKDNTP